MKHRFPSLIVLFLAAAAGALANDESSSIVTESAPKCSLTLGAKHPLGYEVTVSGAVQGSDNGGKILVGFRDGFLKLRDPRTGFISTLKQSDFSESELGKVREALAPFQSSVKSIGAQLDLFTCGVRKKPLWFTKEGGHKRPGDLGVNGIPPHSANLRIRGLSTTYPFEVPAKVVIVWIGASPARESAYDECGFKPGEEGDSSSASGVCKRDLAYEDYELTLQGTPCDIYTRPVYRCALEQDCHYGYRYNRHVVVVLNRLTRAVLYTNSTDAKLVATIVRADAIRDEEIKRNPTPFDAYAGASPEARPRHGSSRFPQADAVCLREVEMYLNNTPSESNRSASTMDSAAGLRHRGTY